MSTTAAAPRPRWRPLVAFLGVIALLGAGTAPAQAADILVLHINTGDVEIVVTRADDPEFINYRVEATNLSTETVHLGFGADLRQKGTTDYFWLESSELFDLGARGQAVIEPGMTYEEGFLPRWSGMTYSFYSDIDTVPTLIGEFVNAGLYLPFDVQSADGAITAVQVGYPVTIHPVPARAGESIRIDSAVGSDWPDSDIGVWIREIQDDDSSALLEAILARGLFGESTSFTDSMRQVGSVPVSTNVAAGNVTLPSDLSPGDYVLLLGDDGVGWPGGPATGALVDEQNQTGINLVIEEGPPRGTTTPGVEVAVTPLDQFGTTPVSFTFDEVTTAGTTSVTTSTTGPAATSFTLLGGANAVYYELETTAEFAGLVTVCLSYDPTDLSEAQQNSIALFHYTGGAWSDITTDRYPGQVCGETDSFSPFALGIPTLQYAFEGFLSPINNGGITTALAGTVVPIRFRLGGDQGLNVIVPGSPVSGQVACSATATAAVTQPTQAAASLQYARSSQTYWYFWEAPKSWGGTCRQFVMTLDDGSVHTAVVKFEKLTLRNVIKAILRAI